MWHRDGPQGNEARKIRHLAVNYTRGSGLDIGCGANKLHHGCIGVDSGKQWNGPVADVTCDGTHLTMFADETQDFVFSSHFLEHVEDPQAALAEWWRVLKPGGNLVLYLPHADLYPRVGQPGANPDHKSDFRPRDILLMMRAVAKDTGVTVLENEDRNAGNGLEQFSEYSFFQVYQKRDDRQFEADPWVRHPGKDMLIIRYGGAGDALIAASILPQFKRDGWHITWNGAEKAAELLAHDPHIDRWWLQDREAIPNAELSEYWSRLGERFDVVHNLCESMEGDLLRLPNRLNYDRPKEIMHEQCNVNYGEYAHRLVGLPYEPHQKMYYTDAEAAEVLEKAGLSDGALDVPVVVWQMSGSAAHKLWPYHHNAIVMALYKTDAIIVVTGGGESDIEAQKLVRKAVDRMYGETDRVRYMIGELSLREACILANQADVVLGPETGVLNSVAMEPDIAKLIFLSHSSRENLTKHWQNVHEVIPEAHCHPCHKLVLGLPGQPGWQGACPIDDQTSLPICTSFLPGPVVDRLVGILAERRKREPAPLHVVADDEDAA